MFQKTLKIINSKTCTVAQISEKLRVVQENIGNVVEIIEEKQKVIARVKLERDLLRDELFGRLDYLLQHPEWILKVGMTIEKVISYELMFGMKVKSYMLGGDFSMPEKQYLIDLCQIQLGSPEEKQRSRFLSRAKKERNQNLGGGHNGFQMLKGSTNMFPASRDLRVSFQT